jgi:hypothetical protein
MKAIIGCRFGGFRICLAEKDRDTRLSTICTKGQGLKSTG